MHTYSILSVPFYDTRWQQYTKILCINTVPVAGALATRVKTVRPPRLSGLCSDNGVGNSNNNNKCIHVITSSASASAGACSAVSGFCDYMTPEQLPELFAFLVSNGYTVDTALTKLAAKHQSGGGGCGNGTGTNANSLVCLISIP
jgi:hypothetical protein